MMELAVAKKLTKLIKDKNIEQLEKELNKIQSQLLHVLNDKSEYCGSSSMLHFAVGLSCNEIDIVKLLLDKGADPSNLNCDDRISPLHLSVLYNFDRVFAVLFEYGGDPYLEDNDGKSCFDFAYKKSHRNIWKLLIEPPTTREKVKSTWNDDDNVVNVEIFMDACSSRDDDGGNFSKSTTLLTAYESMSASDKKQVSIESDSVLDRTLPNPILFDDIMPSIFHSTPKFKSTPKNAESEYVTFRNRLEATFAPKSERYAIQFSLRKLYEENENIQGSYCPSPSETLKQ